MRRDLLRTGALALAFAGVVGISGAAQVKKPRTPADAQQRSQQEKAQQTPSGKMGGEEPGSQAQTPKPQENAVFVNGALAVDGAPANADTVPAKYSRKNAADDELITIAYTFKTLSDDERRAIYEMLKSPPAGTAFNADIGTELPPGIELRPVPDDLAARVPQIKDYRYAVTQTACCWWARAGSSPASSPARMSPWAKAAADLKAIRYASMRDWCRFPLQASPRGRCGS